MLVVGASLAGCRPGNGPGPTTPRIITETLVAIVPTTLAPNPASYTIQQGDTLTAISDRFHLDVTALATANAITNLDDIEAGQTLTIPITSPATTTTAP